MDKIMDNEYSTGAHWLKQHRKNKLKKQADKRARAAAIKHNTAINKERKAAKRRLV